MKVKDKKKALDFLESKTGATRKYQGPPTFSYKIGELTLTREGEIEGNLTPELVAALDEAGILEPLIEKMSIELPLEPYEGRQLRNLIYLLRSRQTLINKSAGCKAVEISDELVVALQRLGDASLEETLATFEANKQSCTGLTIEDGKIAFTDFPTEVSTTMVYTTLIGGINQMALSQKRIYPTEHETESEKYSMRVWLVRMGFGGDEHKSLRKILLANLGGHAAFKNEAAKERWNAQRLAKKEGA